MKFIISIFLISKALATPINLYYEGSLIEAKMLQDILINDYLIPDELIGIQGVLRCDEVKREGQLDLCLKNNGDLFMVSVDRNFIEESVKVFRAP